MAESYTPRWVPLKGPEDEERLKELLASGWELIPEGAEKNGRYLYNPNEVKPGPGEAE